TNKSYTCSLHNEETTTILQGITKGYPTEIDFNILTSQVSKLFLLLTDIINKKISSFYYDWARQIINNMGQPGYYRAKGLSIIAEYLQEYFIIKKKILMKDHISPQTPNQYLYDILVPETTLCLIFEDHQNIALEEA
ncbi:1152_t:CDS:2, partial [Scutellospora calospora]